MSRHPDPSHALPAAPAPAGATPLVAGDDSVVSSATVFNGRSSVFIDHGGERYLLRTTRSGKLILTK